MRTITKQYSYVGICTDGYLYYLTTSTGRTLVQQMEDLFVTNDYQISEEELDIETQTIKSTVIINKVGSKIIQIQRAKRQIKKLSNVEVTFKNGDVEIISSRRFRGRYNMPAPANKKYGEGTILFDDFCITEVKSIRKKTS